MQVILERKVGQVFGFNCFINNRDNKHYFYAFQIKEQKGSRNDNNFCFVWVN